MMDKSVIVRKPTRWYEMCLPLSAKLASIFTSVFMPSFLRSRQLQAPNFRGFEDHIHVILHVCSNIDSDSLGKPSRSQKIGLRNTR